MTAVRARAGQRRQTARARTAAGPGALAAIQRGAGNAALSAALTRLRGGALARLVTPGGAERLASPGFVGNERLRRAVNNAPALHVGETGEAVRLVQETLVLDGFELPGSTLPT